MAQLTKERDHLFETIRTYRLLFETTRQLINEMQGTVSSYCYRVVLKESEGDLLIVILYFESSFSTRSLFTRTKAKRRT